MLRRVALARINVWDELSASIVTVIRIGELGRNNVSRNLQPTHLAKKYKLKKIYDRICLHDCSDSIV
jgi:hypothetical protein